MSFIAVFIFCFLTSIFFFNSGIFFNRLFFKINIQNNIIEYSILGIISLSCLALFANFIFSLNIYFNTIIISLFLCYLFFLNNRLIKKIILYSIIISLISTITIIFDNTNRPDSGLYHLPFTSLLNGSKISFGVANINERFGIISIIQYLSALNNNLIFNNIGILIPLVIIYSITLIFFINSFFKKNKSNLIKFLSFLFAIFILTTSNRYSSFGNDAPAQFFYLILIYYFLESSNDQRNEDHFKLISLLSIFVFLIKPFFILSAIIPILFIFNKYKKIKIFNLTTYIVIIIFCAWIVKNIIITGCFLYPINLTCLDLLDWSVNKNKFALESEAWAKGWPDRFDKSLDYKEYLEKFYWIKVWFNNHFKFILLKLAPIIIFLMFLSVILLLKFKTKKSEIHKELNQLLIFNVIFLIIWFSSFPLYRFGSSILISIIALLFIKIFLNKIDLDNYKLKKSLILILIFMSIGIFLKNMNRIVKNYSNYYVDYPWPKINSATSDNRKLTYFTVKENNKILYYLSPYNELCFYGKSPCTHIRDKKIKKTNYLYFYDKYTAYKN